MEEAIGQGLQRMQRPLESESRDQKEKMPHKLAATRGLIVILSPDKFVWLRLLQHVISLIKRCDKVVGRHDAWLSQVALLTTSKQVAWHVCGGVRTTHLTRSSSFTCKSARSHTAGYQRVRLSRSIRQEETHWSYLKRGWRDRLKDHKDHSLNRKRRHAGNAQRSGNWLSVAGGSRQQAASQLSCAASAFEFHSTHSSESWSFIYKLFTELWEWGGSRGCGILTVTES